MAAAPQNRGWIWRKAESEAIGDPAAIPENSEAHQSRIDNSQWGPRWTRICPVIIEGPAGGEIAVKDILLGTSHRVQRTQLLPWLEGLLVLDSIVRSGAQVPWFTKLKDIFEQEMARYKDGLLRSSMYVEQKILNMAVTGPVFVDSKGKKYTYRRMPLRTDAPQEATPGNGLYQVQALEQYLPPWEAFVHPKCGLYQDWYMVHWAGPYARTDYSQTENGGEGFGTTWEPDELLVDDLDKLRTIAKRRWVDKQKAREQKATDELRAGGGDRIKREALAATAGEAAGTGEPSQKKGRYNSQNVMIFDDILSPHVGHGWKYMLESTGEEMIKQGWPKNEAEYPKGFAPCKPPGACSDSCNCMEDWHIGLSSSMDAEKRWLSQGDREARAEAALSRFMADANIVRRRGQVSNMHYLEAIQEVRSTPDLSPVEFCKLVRSGVGEAAQAVPLAALQGLDTESRELVSVYACVFATCGPLTYVPVRFKVKEGPSWLFLDPQSGLIDIVEDIRPETMEKKRIPLTIDLIDIFGQAHRMGLAIFPDRPAHGGDKLGSLTNKVVMKISRLKSPALQRVITDLMRDIYDFERKAYRCIALSPLLAKMER